MPFCEVDCIIQAMSGTAFKVVFACFPVKCLQLSALYTIQLNSHSAYITDCQQSCLTNLWSTGIEKVHSLPSGLSSYEQDALKALMPELSSSIQKGIDFANKK